MYIFQCTRSLASRCALLTFHGRERARCAARLFVRRAISCVIIVIVFVIQLFSIFNINAQSGPQTLR